MKKILFCFVLILAAALTVGPALSDSAPSVAVSFLPVEIFAENVTDGTGAGITLLAPNASGCLHDYQLLPGDLTRLNGTDILFVNGAGMEVFLKDITDVYPDLRIVDLSEGIDLIPADDDEGEFNSHIWLSPKNAAVMVRNMADALAEYDQARAEQYTANADRYISRLTELDGILARRCEKLARKDIITFHEAFPDFARDYGLNVLAVIALEPDEGISPRRLAELSDIVRQYHCPPLFIEAQYPSEPAEALARETGAKIYELLTVTSGPAGMEAYEEALLRNMDTLEEALGILP